MEEGPWIPEFWHWWVLALLFLLLCRLLPNHFYPRWVVMSLLVGGLVWLFPEMVWGFQVLAFGVMTVLYWLLDGRDSTGGGDIGEFFGGGDGSDGGDGGG